MNLALHQEIEHVGPALVHLEHRFHRNAAGPEIPGGPGRAQHPESEFVEAPGDGHHGGLVAVIHRDADRPLQGKRPVGADLGLGEGHAEGVGDPHDLAGGAHLRAEDQVHTGQLAEREDRLLHRHVGLQHVVHETEVGQRPADHQGRGHARQGDSDRFRHEGHGARGAGVDLQHVHDPLLHRVLDVEETDHAEPDGEGPGVLPHLLHLLLGDQIRRQHAGTVAGVDAGVLDVLHHPADDAARPVRERVDIGLESILEERIDEHRMPRRHPHGFREEPAQRVGVVHDPHRPSPQDVGGADQDRIPDAFRHGRRFLEGRGGAGRRLNHTQFPRDRLETAAILRPVDRLGRGAEDADALGLQSAGQAEGRLPAELHHHPHRLLHMHNFEHILEGERFEVQGIRHVEVGGDGFRIRVDHHRPVPHLAELHRGPHTAVVELHSLPDPVRSAAEDDHGLPVTGADLVLVVIAGIEVGGGGGKFPGAGVHHLVGGTNAQAMAFHADVLLRATTQISQLPIGEALSLHPAHQGAIACVILSEGSGRPSRLRREKFGQLGEEPQVDARALRHVLHGQARLQRPLDLEHPLRGRTAESRSQGFRVGLGEAILGGRADGPPRPLDFQSAETLLERFLEGAADRHHLPHRLHLRGQDRIGGGKLLEGEPGDLHHHVVQHRLEGGGSGPGDVVGQFVESVPHRQLGPDPRNRVAGGLGGEGAGAGHAGVHLDDQLLARARIDRELDIAPTRRDADFPDDAAGRVAHDLVFAVAQSHRGRHGDRVPGVHPHGVNVLNGTDDDDVVRRVAHHLELELFPSDDALLHEHRAHRRQFEPSAEHRLKLLRIVGDPPPPAPQREGGAENRRVAGLGHGREPLFHGAHRGPARRGQSDPAHRRRKLLPILRDPDGPFVRPDQFHSILFQHA